MARAGGYLVLNLKTYRESMGERGMRLCRIADEVARETGAKITVCPQLADLRWIAKSIHIPVFAQHVDAYEPGAHTGHISPESVKDAGANGTLINHSERKLPEGLVGETVRRCRSVGLLSLVCAATVEESKAMAAFRPDFIAVEPPELIGSGIAVSKADPEIVENSVAAVRGVANIPVLCGAGISTAEDVAKAMELGASGVLLASAYVKAKEPKELLLDMARSL